MKTVFNPFVTSRDFFYYYIFKCLRASRASSSSTRLCVNDAAEHRGRSLPKARRSLLRSAELLEGRGRAAPHLSASLLLWDERAAGWSGWSPWNPSRLTTPPPTRRSSPTAATAPGRPPRVRRRRRRPPRTTRSWSTRFDLIVVFRRQWNRKCAREPRGCVSVSGGSGSCAVRGADADPGSASRLTAHPSCSRPFGQLRGGPDVWSDART